ncbi:MAG: hypothetical protein J6D06_07925 [Clostridia bacterium]|nr:hypothetical protein [Clostridia bacterium]
MALFGKKSTNGAAVMNPYARYNKSIYNILLVVVFSAINIVMLATNSGSYFLFSAIIPYFIVDYGMFWSGMYPAEEYVGIAETDLMDSSFFAITIVVAVVMILAYLVCWLFARKMKVGALIAALVFFIIDTVGMFYLYDITSDFVLDIVFHGWVIVSLIIGIVTYFKVKKAQPEESQLNEFNDAAMSAENSALNGSSTSDPYGTNAANSFEGTDIEG